MEQGDPFETFQLGKHESYPYISGVFQLDEPKKTFSIYIPTEISGIF